MKKVLVVAAHTDDEALGCGGTIAKHVASGDEVSAIFMTNGIGSRGENAEESSRRSLRAQNASNILGYRILECFEYPDNQMDSVPLLEVVKSIEYWVNDFRPNTIYTHHPFDLNVDHRIVHDAVLTACRPQPASFVEEVFTFEVLSSTEWQNPLHANFAPNVFVDIGLHLQTKLLALEAYESEMRDYPHSRSLQHIRSLAAHRGNSVGVEYAESFMQVRRIIK